LFVEKLDIFLHFQRLGDAISKVAQGLHMRCSIYVSSPVTVIVITVIIIVVAAVAVTFATNPVQAMCYQRLRSNSLIFGCVRHLLTK
jgi:hypothetical protein